MTAEQLIRSEELWDEYSQHIDDDIFSLERFAGRVVLTQGDYKSLIKELLGTAGKEKEEQEQQIGTLNSAYEIKGYETALPGHPVYELKDRYLIYLKHRSLPDLRVPFYKDSLQGKIDFS